MKPTPGNPYTTKKGDTLESIANQAYGDPNQHTLISDFNASQIVYDYDEQIPIGTILLIPVDLEIDSIIKKQRNNGIK